MNIVLKAIDISVTNKCNFRCLYCNNFSNNYIENEEVTVDKWVSFIKKLKNSTISHIILTGGEPFIREDLKSFIDSIVESEIRFSILSNGSLITDQIAHYLSSTGKCIEVQISIDDSTHQNHDVFRGKGSFELALRGIEYLKKHGVNISVRTTLHKKNFQHIEHIVKFILEDLNIPYLGVMSAFYMGACKQHHEIIQLSIDERAIVMEKLSHIQKTYKNRVCAPAGPLAEIYEWSAMEKAKDNIESLPLNNGGYLNGCGGVMHKLSIRADGVIVPCLKLSHIELGRINEDDINEIWFNHKELVKLRDRQKIPLSDFELCSSCIYQKYCTGGCPGLSYELTGKINHPNPDQCYKIFIEKGGKLPV